MPFLADPGRIVQKDLDIQEYTDPDNDPMIPYTIVLKRGLVVHRVTTATGSGPPVGLRPVRDLREVFAEVRPDWDLAKPGLREAMGRPATTRASTAGSASPEEIAPPCNANDDVGLT